MHNYFLSINISNIYPLLIIILFFFSFYILKQNKLLKTKINKIEEDKNTSNSKIEKTKDTISIEEISKETKQNEEIKKEPNNLEVPKKEIKKPNISTKKYYTKNILNNKKRNISPISLNNNIKFNPNDYIKKDNFEKSKDKSFNLLELSKKLEKELEPKTIELTEYEKEQEENAVISYQELLKVKDKIYRVDDEEDTKYFIEELKKFRNSLN